MATHKRLLLTYHSQSGHTFRLMQAVHDGAASVPGVDVRLRHAQSTVPADVLTCDGIVLGTPENFGYMSGVLKDFYDRCYEPCLERTAGLPFALLVCAGNDGRGAINAQHRIILGLGWREISPPLRVIAPADGEAHAQARALGEAFANGLALGIF